MASKHVYGIIGGMAALVSAAAWALGSILFRRLGEKVSPFGINLVKCMIGTLFLGIAILLFGIEPISLQTFLLLGGSGLLGIAFGDTFFFKALMYLEPRVTILLGTLGSVFTVFLSILFLRENPSLRVWAGIIVTLTGVTWVLWDHVPREKVNENRVKGIIYALASALCMSLGIVLAKKGVNENSTLQATFMRLLWAAVGLIVWGGMSHQLKKSLSPFKDTRLLRFTILSVFVIIFGGFWLFIVSLKYIDASIAVVLNSTTPLFILPMTALMMQEKITGRAILGACAAVCGIILIFLG